jgi:hypothetical protein
MWEDAPAGAAGDWVRLHSLAESEGTRARYRQILSPFRRGRFSNLDHCYYCWASIMAKKGNERPDRIENQDSTMLIV